MSALAGARRGRRPSRVEIAILDRRIAVARFPLRRVLLRVLEDHAAAGILSLAVLGDEEIRRLHDEFLGIDAPTDVLSFPLAARQSGSQRARPAEDGVLGEVVLSAETAARAARRRGLEPERELALYAIHGCLHLVGYDDIKAADRARMRAAERRYLRFWEEARGDSRGRRSRPSARSRSSRRRGGPRPDRRPRPGRA